MSVRIPDLTNILLEIPDIEWISSSQYVDKIRPQKIRSLTGAWDPIYVNFEAVKFSLALAPATANGLQLLPRSSN